jgi:arylsulfatase
LNGTYEAGVNLERTKQSKTTGKKKKHETKLPRHSRSLSLADEGADVGIDGETAVSNDYKQGDNKLTGKATR